MPDGIPIILSLFDVVGEDVLEEKRKEEEDGGEEAVVRRRKVKEEGERLKTELVRRMEGEKEIR